MLKDAAPDDEFMKELEIMATMRSPNVVFFYGALMRPKTAIVVEYFANGSLVSRRTRGARARAPRKAALTRLQHDVMCGKSTDVLFDWDLVLRLAIGAARAVTALHSWRPAVVHRDLSE